MKSFDANIAISGNFVLTAKNSIVNLYNGKSTLKFNPLMPIFIYDTKKEGTCKQKVYKVGFNANVANFVHLWKTWNGKSCIRHCTLFMHFLRRSLTHFVKSYNFDFLGMHTLNTKQKFAILVLLLKRAYSA